MAVGKEAEASGRILGVLLSGRFENNKGKVILMDTPLDIANRSVEGFQRVHQYTKLVAALAAVLFCLSLFLLWLSNKRKA